MNTDPITACLLLQSQNRSTAAAFCEGLGIAASGRILPGTVFALAEEACLSRLDRSAVSDLRLNRTPLFLLMEPGRPLPVEIDHLVTYVFYKPLSLELVLRRIVLLLGGQQTNGGRSEWFCFQAQCSLDALGVQRHLLAFAYFSDAIGILAQKVHPSRTKLMNQLYPALAQRHGSSPVMVDRAMRHGVESCWHRADKSVQRQYFGYSLQDKKGMPTNGEFLFALFEHVKMLLPYDTGKAAFMREIMEINLPVTGLQTDLNIARERLPFREETGIL
ncbi:MAG: sporulation initiation factor Spo0A C-terminal domain-containing protein [Clostridia bacterium]|nr:sporulation initiation factor Spo0A C-terminal domain-containing protein [Clostridia bacterium]